MCAYVCVCVQGQPSQSQRAAASVAVQSHVEAVVAATRSLRAGGDRQTATASRDAALAAIRSTMAALHPEVEAAEVEVEAARAGKATTVEGVAQEMLERFVRTLVTGVAAAKEKETESEGSSCVVTKDDVAAALASSPFAGMVRPRSSSEL